MEGNVTKVAMYFRKTDEAMERTRTDLIDIKDLTSLLKFDIDKITSLQGQHEERITRNQNEINKCLLDIVKLKETKTDLSIYEKEKIEMNETLEQGLRTALMAESLTKNMIDFIHKYEPIYIQRQITQTLTNVFPDPNVQWRLNWFNDIKMPMLTTLLMYKSEINLSNNMEKFEKTIELKSLTSDELFMKNATKSNQMQ